MGYFSYPNLNSSCLYLVPRSYGGPTQALDKSKLFEYRKSPSQNCCFVTDGKKENQFWGVKPNSKWPLFPLTAIILLEAVHTFAWTGKRSCARKEGGKHVAFFFKYPHCVYMFTMLIYITNAYMSKPWHGISVHYHDLKSWLCHLVCVEPWTSHLTSLCLGSTSVKWGQ